MTPSDLADSNGIMIERNVHVKLEISEEGREKKAVEDYRVVAINTKTYNKWFVCEVGRQSWSPDIQHGKYRVLVRMIQFDHSMEKWKDCMPFEITKWTKKRFYVLCDAADVN